MKRPDLSSAPPDVHEYIERLEAVITSTISEVELMKDECRKATSERDKGFYAGLQAAADTMMIAKSRMDCGEPETWLHEKVQALQRQLAEKDEAMKEQACLFLDGTGKVKNGDGSFTCCYHEDYFRRHKDACDLMIKNIGLEAALREAVEAHKRVVERSHNDPLGTSKVIDMRNISAAIVAKQEKSE